MPERSDILASDVPFLVKLHQEAFPDFFLSRLGAPFLSEFYKGFISDSTAITVVARDDNGIPIGVSVGTTQPARFFRRLLARRLVGFARASLMAVLRDPRVAPRLATALWYRGDGGSSSRGALLSSICIAPSHRGLGLGRQLLRDWTLRASLTIATEAYLLTDAEDNDAVNQLYSSEGWTLAEQVTRRTGRKMNVYTRDLSTISRKQDEPHA